MDENVNWMETIVNFIPLYTHLLSIFSLNQKVPFLYIYISFNILNSLLNVYLEKNNTSPFCITMYIDSSNESPSYTHISSYVVWRIQPWD